MVEGYAVERTKMPQYGECEYWDERYSREPAAFDWYQGFNGLDAILQLVFPKESTLLQVGVGSSRLQEAMAEAGWRRIVNIDYSRVVITHMSELHRRVRALEYRVADVRSMPEFHDESIDGVLDKGTLDAILCGERSSAHAAAMVSECFRVLKPGRTLMLVTYGDPTSRLPYLEAVDGWEIVVYAITKQEVVEALNAEPVIRPIIKGPYPASNVDCMDALSGLEGMHFVYICRKDPKPPPPLPDALLGESALVAQHELELPAGGSGTEQEPVLLRRPLGLMEGAKGSSGGYEDDGGGSREPEGPVVGTSARLFPTFSTSIPSP